MRLVSIALCVLLFPSIGSAQNRGIFVQAGPLADFLFTTSASDLAVEALSTAGIDVTMGLNEHLAVVPEVRLVAANRALSVRPAVSMRWRP